MEEEHRTKILGNDIQTPSNASVSLNITDPVNIPTLDFEEDEEIEVEEVEELLGQDERNEEENQSDPEDLNSDEIFFDFNLLNIDGKIYTCL